MRSAHDIASPGAIRLRDWRAILVRVFNRMMADNLGVLAGGVAFYGFLSVFPALVGGLMVWGMFTDGSSLVDQLSAVQGPIPGSAYELVAGEMIRIASQSSEGLQLGAVFTLLLALWSASRGVAALIGVMNMAYHETEKRGFIRVNLMALVFTVGGVGFVVVSVLAIAAVPPILEALYLGSFIEAFLGALRWLFMIGLFLGAAAIIYRYGPSRQKARWRWIMPGAAAAALIWLVASIAFSFYLSNFDAYNATFGSLGAVAALLMWFWLSAYAICMGAELNSQLELFTTVDTTVADDHRPGERGAYVADHIENPETAEGPTPQAETVTIPQSLERSVDKTLG
ncbi:MAG: YihY/virulence factor BrkB family protein [Alphaproteobacteria bacterium]|nr:YihY/virulence factor BrkB family protein [Alphaproteobacteria bacterium]